MSARQLYNLILSKMISLKLLVGAAGINKTVAPAINIIPRLTNHEDRDRVKLFEDQHQRTDSRASLSTSCSMRQPAPLLTPKTPKLNSDLQEAETDLPQRPKKPVTPWISFLRDHKDEQLRHRSMKASELAAILAKEWQSADKSRYLEEYKQRQEEYRRAIESYESSLNDQQRALIKLKKDLKRESKAMKKLRSLNPPILPRNPANMYCVERCKDPDIKARMKIKKSSLVLGDLFAEYRNLSPSEKERYLELQQKDKQRFQHEFNQWYNGIQSDSSLSKTVREKADLLHARFKALNWI